MKQHWKNNENDMDDKANNDILEKKENVWIVPKKNVPIDKLLKKYNIN